MHRSWSYFSIRFILVCTQLRIEIEELNLKIFIIDNIFMIIC